MTNKWQDFRKYEFNEVASLSKEKFNPKQGKISLPCIELEHISKEDGRLVGETESHLQNSTKNRFSPGDVLFGKLRPYLRKYYHADFEGVCSSEIWVFKNNKNICESKYLFYLIQSHRFIKAVSVTCGSKMPRADWAWISAFPVSLPPIHEQNKIVKILTFWDKAIEKTVRLIESKAKLKQALMQQILTGKLRFKEFVKSNRKIGTHYGVIPADWKYPKVEEIAKEVSNRNEKGRDIPVLSCTKYDGLVDSLKYFGKRIFSEDTSDYKIVRRGQFAYATNHIEEGSIGLLNFLEEGLVSPMYTVFKTDRNVYAPFLYKVFKTELYRHIFEANTSGSIDRRGSLRWKQFSQIHIPLPSVEEQKRISACIDTYDREIKLLQQSLEALKIQKKGLMQKLLTGQIRVKV